MGNDARLENSSFFVLDLKLCQVRLVDNLKFPWVLLIPRRENIVEIIDLSEEDQAQLMREISQTSRIFQKLFKPHKLNVAALGNVVPQLHVHVIARYETDEAWPNPVWNSCEPQKYDDVAINKLVEKIIKIYE